MSLYSSLSDATLVSLLNQGDQEAYAQIFERYKAVLYQHAYRILQDEDESNDVVQDLFMVLWHKRDSFNINTSLSGYLYSAIRNRVFDIIAHRKVASKYLDSIRAFIDKGEFVTDEQIREKELAKIIEINIENLPARMREIFELSRNQELSYRDVAKQLQLSEKTVKQQVYNAVKILRRKLGNHLSFLLFF